MKPKIHTGRTPRGRAPGKLKPDPRQAELPNTQAEGETAGDAGAPARPTMKLVEVLAELENLAKPLDVRVTYEAIGGELGAGGLCKVKGHWRVIIDKRTTPSERVSVLAASLARFDFASLQVSPQVRELLARFAPAPAEPAAEPTAKTAETGEAAETADSTAEAGPIDDETSNSWPQSADANAGSVEVGPGREDSVSGAAAGLS